MDHNNSLLRAGRSLTMLALILGTANFSIFGQNSSAGSTRMTVWSGIYTQDQATQGQAVYTARCARCHGDRFETGRSSVEAMARVTSLLRADAEECADDHGKGDVRCAARSAMVRSSRSRAAG